MGTDKALKKYLKRVSKWEKIKSDFDVTTDEEAEKIRVQLKNEKGRQMESGLSEDAAKRMAQGIVRRTLACQR